MTGSTPPRRRRGPASSGRVRSVVGMSVTVEGRPGRHRRGRHPGPAGRRARGRGRGHRRRRPGVHAPGRAGRRPAGRHGAARARAPLRARRRRLAGKDARRARPAHRWRPQLARPAPGTDRRYPSAPAAPGPGRPADAARGARRRHAAPVRPGPAIGDIRRLGRRKIEPPVDGRPRHRGRHLGPGPGGRARP